MKLRLGESGTRATSDLDVSTVAAGATFEERFRQRLAAGWGEVPPSIGERRRNQELSPRTAFTGSVRARKPHDPGLTRPEYLMRPYRVTLAFLGKGWAGLDVEVSDAELDLERLPPRRVDRELSQFAEFFGFGELRPVPIIGLEEQIAQKLHAVTDPTYQRAHDLVDLQLLWEVGPDLALLHSLCVRTFAWRRRQTWPPLPLRSMETWELAYEVARAETKINGRTAVARDVAAAREWLTNMITQTVSVRLPD